MALGKWILGCAFLIGCAAPLVLGKKAVVCYSVAWAVTRPGDGKYSVLDANTEDCTHVIYAFMGLDQDTSEIKSIDPKIDLPQNGRGHDQLAQLKRLKERNPELKVMVSIGGYNEKGRKMSNVAGDPHLREKFISSVLNFLQKYELDGLDICWQFPGQRGGRKEDKQNSVILFQEIKDAFKPHGYILTIHILGKKYIIDEYDIRAVSEIVDYINLIPVEFSGPWERTTGIIAPLETKNQNNVKFAVDYTVKKAVNPNKIILGVPLYGHAYVLEETPSKDNLIGLFSDKTFHGQWTNEGGIIGFYETCYNFKNEEGWTKVWHNDSKTPLAFNEKRFISYDDERSLKLKADLIETRSLGGVMFWSLDMDDFRGNCFGKKYPMVSAISEYINRKDTQPRPNEESEDPDGLGTPDQLGEITHQISSGPLPPSPPPPSPNTPVDENHDGPKVVVCYIAAWSTERFGEGRFSILDADVDHCTHIIYAFMTVHEGTHKIKSVDEFIDNKQLHKLKELKKRKPGLKVMASVGGYGQGSTRFSTMAESSENRRTFISSVLKFLRDYQLDGIDICWQFPTQRGGKPEDKDNSLKLFQELKAEFRPHGYLLTVHVLGQKYVINSYHIEEVSKVVDYINFLAVEYHGPWEQLIWPTTPLTSSDESNVKYNLDYILHERVPPSKLLLGLPTYGHAYLTAEPLRGKYIGIHYDRTITSRWTNEPGLVAYNEVCSEKKLSGSAWHDVEEDISQTQISHVDQSLYSYDNVKTLKLKAKLALQRGLAGVAFWSLDMDDFQGLCDGKKYPLVSAVTEYINKPRPRPQPTPPFIDLINVRSQNNSQVFSYEFGKK